MPQIRHIWSAVAVSAPIVQPTSDVRCHYGLTLNKNFAKKIHMFCSDPLTGRQKNANKNITSCSISSSSVSNLVALVVAVM